VLIEWFSLFWGIDAKKLRKSRVLAENEALGTSLKREKKSQKCGGPRKQAWRA